jgi:hypothetical protein
MRPNGLPLAQLEHGQLIHNKEIVMAKLNVSKSISRTLSGDEMAVLDTAIRGVFPEFANTELSWFELYFDGQQCSIRGSEGVELSALASASPAELAGLKANGLSSLELTAQEKLDEAEAVGLELHK